MNPEAEAPTVSPSTQQLLRRMTPGQLLPEREARLLASEFNISVPVSVRLDAQDLDMRDIGALRPPFVLKVVSPDVVHKSDVGGVRVGLNNATEVAEAVRIMLENFAAAGVTVSGFIVDELVPADYEIVLGGRVDEVFGPIIMLGIGGIFVELLGDVAFRVCPITERDVSSMLDELRGAEYFEGLRGRPRLNKELLTELVLQVGGEHGLLPSLATVVSEVDFNPIRMSANSAIAVDVRVVAA